MYGLFAGFGSAALELTRERMLAAIEQVAPAEVDFYTDGRAVSLALLSPRRPEGAAVIEWSRGGRLGCALDGYVVTDRPGASAVQRGELVRLIESVGLDRALAMLEAGSFNVATLDLDRTVFTVANDRVGSIPLYYAPVPGGCVVATAPYLATACGLVTGEPDLTAIAELVYLGHTVGDRYYSKAMRRLPPACTLEWDDPSARLSVTATDLSPIRLGPADRRPDIDQIAELTRTACRRVAGLSDGNALLLSGGMDSRLILAAWPDAARLPCYSYGPREFADVMLARQVASVRGASFTHVPLPGSQVSASIDEMLRLSGPPAFPSRYLAARRIGQDGLDTALDGYAGDVLLGGSFYDVGRFLSRPERWMQLANRLGDRRVREVGFEALVEELYESLVDRGAADWLARHADGDVVRLLTAQRPTILQDIWTVLREMAPPDGSVAVAVRDFKLMQKALHSTINQGVLCRRFVRVAYPLFCDNALLRATWTIAPRYTAFRQLYVRLFRKHFPAYAAIPYAESLLPLRRSPLAHRWAKSFRSYGIRFPLKTRAVIEERYDEWNAWLRESAALRGRAIGLLADLGLSGPAKLQAAIEPIGSGEAKGSGDLFHVGAVAQLVSPLRCSA
ncbi:MAG TPA: asparagine synthase-related protein [Methylomirabilota bacterium]|nr:asparagine synthase-related protein [Methylomirabilota bacterium]